MSRILEVVEVSRDNFHQIVTDRQGCTFVSLVARYVPSHFANYLRGRFFPYLNNIYCVSNVVCAVGVNYENNVNNALERQGRPRDFKQSGEPWGPMFRHANDAAIIRHIKDDRTYLQVRVMNRTYQYYTLDGKPIPYRKIESFKIATETDHGVVLRRYRFDHLVEVVMRQRSEPESKRYVLTD